MLPPCRIDPPYMRIQTLFSRVLYRLSYIPPGDVVVSDGCVVGVCVVRVVCGLVLGLSMSAVGGGAVRVELRCKGRVISEIVWSGNEDLGLLVEMCVCVCVCARVRVNRRCSIGIRREVIFVWSVGGITI